MTEPLVEMFRHNSWANLRLLDGCAGLDDDVLDASVVGTAGSIRDTLAHLVNVEARYVAMLHEVPHPPPEFFRFPGFAELRQRAETSGEALIAFAGGKTSTGLCAASSETGRTSWRPPFRWCRRSTMPPSTVRM